MKKILSVALSLIMLISCFGLAPAEAFAAMPEIKVDETVNVFVPSNEMRKSKHVKFVPEEDGMYEFSISNLPKLEKPLHIVGMVLDKLDDYSFDYNNNASENKAIVYDGYDNGADVCYNVDSHNKLPGANHTLAVKLQAGKVYYFLFKATDLYNINYKYPDYSFDLTVTKGHTCSYYKNCINPVYHDLDDDYGIIDKDGQVYDYCLTCANRVVLKTIYAVDKVELSSEAYVYDGKAHKPKVTLYDRFGNVISAKNYTLKYSPRYNKYYNIKSPKSFAEVGSYYVSIDFNKNNLYYGFSKEFYEIIPKSAKITSVAAKPGGFTLNWKKQADQNQITGYKIMYNEFGDPLTSYKTKVVTVDNAKALSQTIKNLKANKKYYIRIQTYKYIDVHETGFETDADPTSYYVYSDWSNMVTVTTKAVPKSTTMKSVKPIINCFTVQWNKQPKGTNGYQIKYSTNSEFKDAKYVTIKDTKTTSKTVRNLKRNTKYYVKVRTYKLVDGERFYSSWSDPKSVVTKELKGTSLTKVTANSKGFKATWKKQTKGTNGYQIKYSTSSKFKNAKYVTIKSTKTTSKTVKKLKSKKKYYVKVRTYKIVDGKRCYSTWSKAKAVTTKK